MIHKKKRVTAGEIQASLEILASAKIEDREPSFNLIHLITPKGKVIIKTHLTDREWIASQNLKLKKRKKCSRKK
jgi:hypothetical protein